MIYTVTLNPSLDRTLTVPRIVDDEMVRATASRLDWGGKGFNVSRVLQVLGAESVAMGFAGGATGRRLERGLRRLGIVTDLVPLSGETRTNTVVIESETGRYIKVNESGPTVQPEEQAALLDRIREYLRGQDVDRSLWVLSGSLPPGLPFGFYGELVEIVQAAGARVFLDASGEPMRLGSAAGPFLVKPNAAEALGVIGVAGPAASGLERDGAAFADATALGLAYHFLALGVQLVALSLGAGGLLLATSGRAVRARPPGVQARNPVGAGDALLAGMSWALERDLPLEEMARWGVATGTAAAVGEGVATVTRNDVRVLYQKTSVHQVT